MTFISITRLRVRSVRFMPGFILYTFRAKRQVQRSPGFVAGMFASEAMRLTFWTITAWETEEAMRAYRVTGAHMKAMPKLLDWCDEASVANWTQDDAKLPSPAVLVERMRAEGRISKVRNPTPEQAAGDTVPGGHVPTPTPPFQSLSLRERVAQSAG